MFAFFNLSILLSLYYGNLGFDDFGLIFFAFWSDFDDFKISELFGEIVRFGDLDFILPDC